VRRVLDFCLFQGVWFAAVVGAARDRPAAGPLAALVLLAWSVPRAPRPRRALVRALVAGLAGFALDSLGATLGLLAYPCVPAGWPEGLAPPFVAALWLAFATQVDGSLAWLAGRPRSALLLGAVGGPLSFLAGARLGAVAIGQPAGVAWALLALEFACATWALSRTAGPRVPPGP